MQGKIHIRYSKPSLVKVNMKNKKRTYLMEDFLDGSFTKFTSNQFLFFNDAMSEVEKQLVEFSHWTFMWTDQNLMVVDLQGVRTASNSFTLSDPAIHSTNSMFGKTDLGMKGIAGFFISHLEFCILDKLPLIYATGTLHDLLYSLYFLI